MAMLPERPRAFVTRRSCTGPQVSTTCRAVMDSVLRDLSMESDYALVLEPRSRSARRVQGFSLLCSDRGFRSRQFLKPIRRRLTRKECTSETQGTIVERWIFMRKMISDILVENGWRSVGEADTGVRPLEKGMELRPYLVPWTSSCRDERHRLRSGKIDGVRSAGEGRHVQRARQQALVQEAITAGRAGFSHQAVQTRRAWSR